MTQREKIIIGVLVVLVLAVGVWYVVAPGSFGSISAVTPAQQATYAPATTQTTTTTTTTATTLRAVATKGGNYTCTLTSISTGSQTRGTLYAAAGETRLDFVSKNSQDVDTTVHIIRNGTYSYTWVDGQTSGIKAAITATSPIVPQQPEGGNIIVTDTTQLASDCYPWLPDPTQFVPPAGITFTAN